MNIKDLSKINIKDLQRIDVNDIKNWLKAKPDNLIKILLIIVAIFATMYVYSYNDTREKDFHKEIKDLEEKQEVLQKNKSLQKSMDEFLADFPTSITENQLNNKLADFAEDNSVQIERRSSTSKSSYDHMKTMTVDIDVSTDDYENIILFIKDIEDAPYSIRIDKFTAKSSTKRSYKRSPGSSSDDAEKLKISATIAFSAIELITR